MLGAFCVPKKTERKATMPEKNVGGRPPKPIDKKSFEKLCALQCTKEEICGFFDITDKTLESWCKRTYSQGFSETFRQKRGGGKISLRRTQFRLAEKSASMAIWLGKQYLNQKDRIEDKQEEAEDDGFLDALNGIAAEDWKEPDDEEKADI